MPDTPTEINDQILALHGWKKLPDSERENGWAIYENADGTETAANYSLPDYTLCIDDAWELVTEMFDEGICISITSNPNACPPFICVAQHVEDGETVELAICKAYLHWKGQQ